MKVVFIVNPKAGKGSAKDKLIETLEHMIAGSQQNAEIYITKCPGDATRFVSEFCQTNGGARFIACGGDGTLSEVLNGVMGCYGAEVGVLPVGSGNDFCRNFSSETDFSDILLQITAEAVPCDAIRYTTVLNGVEKTGYCANMFNIGFDCRVADTTNGLKKNTVFGGSFAYVLAIFMELIQKKTTHLTVTADHRELFNGEALLTSVANGKYCGGGIMSNPMASLTDGDVNFNVIKNISRRHFLFLLPSYMKGTHLGIKGIEQVILSGHCKTLTVTPENGTMRLCIDGEIITAGETTFEVVPAAFRLVLPTIVSRKADAVVL